MISRSNENGNRLQGGGRRGRLSHESRGRSRVTEERKAVAYAFQDSYNAYQLPSAEHIRTHKNRWTVVGEDDDTVALRLKHEHTAPQQEIKFVVAAKRLLQRPALYSNITLNQKIHNLTVKGRVTTSFFIRDQTVGTITVLQQ